MPPKIVRMRVAITLKLLGLSHVANSVVGDGSLRGISGGEKRRVSFGIEMVAGHACIIADLPTNGLDSASAYSLMRTMRFATKIGFSMMASVVQPSPQLLRLFHRVMVMSKGTCIYFGPVSQAEEFFKTAGFVRPSAKALPQFIEEVTLKPELFYKTKRYKELSNNEPMTAEQYQQAQRTLTPTARQRHDRAEAGRAEAERRRLCLACTADRSTMQPNLSRSRQQPATWPSWCTTRAARTCTKPGIAKQFDSQPPAHGLDGGTTCQQQGAQVGQPGAAQQHQPQSLRRLHAGAHRIPEQRVLQGGYDSARPAEAAAAAAQAGQALRHSQRQAAAAADRPHSSAHSPACRRASTWTPTAATRLEAGVRWALVVSLLQLVALAAAVDEHPPPDRVDRAQHRPVARHVAHLARDGLLPRLSVLQRRHELSGRAQSRRSLLLHSVLPRFNAVMLVPVLAHQREVYYNQIAGGYYHGFTYYISHFLTQIPSSWWRRSSYCCPCGVWPV